MQIPKTFRLRTLMIAIFICASCLLLLTMNRHDSIFVLGKKVEWETVETKRIPTFSELQRQGFRNVFDALELRLSGVKSTSGATVTKLIERDYRTVSESGHSFSLYLDVMTIAEADYRTVTLRCGGGSNISPFAVLRAEVDQDNSTVLFEFYEVFPGRLKELNITVRILDDGRIERIVDAPQVARSIAGDH